MAKESINKAKKIDELTPDILNGTGKYIIGDKIVRVSHLAEDKKEYMRKYMSEKKDMINNGRREKYHRLKQEGKCPKCGVNLHEDYSHVLCANCRESNRK